MSWTKRIEHPSEVVSKGEVVEVVILDVDSENKRISLGLKQLQEDPWPEIAVRFAEGVEAEGEVVRIQDKGLVVDLGDDIEGFVPASHANAGDSDTLEEAYDPGDEVRLKVLESDAANRRIVLEILGPGGEGGEGEAAPEASAAAEAAVEEAEAAPDEAEAAGEEAVEAEPGGDEAEAAAEEPDAADESEEEPVEGAEEAPDEEAEAASGEPEAANDEEVEEVDEPTAEAEEAGDHDDADSEGAEPEEEKVEED